MPVVGDAMGVVTSVVDATIAWSGAEGLSLFVHPAITKPTSERDSDTKTSFTWSHLADFDFIFSSSRAIFIMELALQTVSAIECHSTNPDALAWYKHCCSVQPKDVPNRHLA